jgi:hypothetical protein
MIMLPQLKHAALIASLSFQTGCSDDDSDIDQVSSTSSDLEALPEIRSSLNNKCLDIRDFNRDNGAFVQMYDCLGGVNQHWYWNGEEIHSSLNDKCLEIIGANSNNGALVQMFECSGGAYQHWYWKGEEIRSRLNDKCLVIIDMIRGNSAFVGMDDCRGGANQHWH